MSTPVSAESAAPFLEITDATLTFAPNVGLFDINLRVPRGTILGVIGPSGCGKSTLVRLLNGLYKPEKGVVQAMGKDPMTFTSEDRERIGYMPQQFVLYPTLTVRENINFVASLYGVGMRQRNKRLKELLQFVDLGEAEKRLASKISGGMQRRVMLAATLMADPTLIYADEPTAGIDPILRERFWEHFRQLRDQGRTLVVTTQYVGEASYCDLVALMYKGRLLYCEPPERLRRIALGGAAIHLHINPEHVRDAIRALSHPLIEDVKRGDEPGLLEVFVDDADEKMPVIFQILNDYPEIEVLSAEEYDPPYDEVFTRLIKQASQKYA